MHVLEWKVLHKYNFRAILYIGQNSNSWFVGRAWQIIPFFLAIILFDYSQKLSQLFPLGIPIILMLKGKKVIKKYMNSHWALLLYCSITERDM